MNFYELLNLSVMLAKLKGKITNADKKENRHVCRLNTK